jgi:hypothetical protein
MSIISYIDLIASRKDREMPYREKIAWLSLTAMAIAYIPYFTIIHAGYLPPRPMPDLHQIGFLGAVSVARVLMLGIGYLVIRHGSQQEARIPPDERDRAIESRSMGAAYYVLMAGMILVGCFMPFSATGWAIVNATVFMIVIAEVVRYALVVFDYRRQA